MQCGRQQSKVKTLLLHCYALRKFYVTDSKTTRDLITSEGPNARNVKVQTNAGYLHATHA